MLRRIFFVCALLLLGSSCVPRHEPVSKKDQQIIAVMMVIGAGIGAGIGAASVSGTDSADAAVGGALAGAFTGYAIGHVLVEHMDRQEKEIRSLEGSKNGEIYVERTRPNVLTLTLEHDAGFSWKSAELSAHGRNALDDISKVVREYEPSTITIVAYSDDASSSKMDRILSEQRAHTVADYLRLKGVGESGINTKGKGRPFLLPASKTAQRNPWYRRIEVMVKGRVN